MLNKSSCSNQIFNIACIPQVNCFFELIHLILNLKVYLLNTGRVGGHDDDPRLLYKEQEREQ